MGARACELGPSCSHQRRQVKHQCSHPKRKVKSSAGREFYELILWAVTRGREEAFDDLSWNWSGCNQGKRCWMWDVAPEHRRWLPKRLSGRPGVLWC